MPSRASEPVEDSDAPIVSVPVGALLVVTSPLEPQPATASARATMTAIFSLICAPIKLINLAMSISMRLAVDGPVGEIVPHGLGLGGFADSSPYRAVTQSERPTSMGTMPARPLWTSARPFR